jgi:hypothetical protein
LADVVTAIGKKSCAQRVGGITCDPFTYLCIGVDATAASSTDTGLLSEITTNGGARGAATVSLEGAGENILKLVKTWDFVGSFSVVESAIMNASTGGACLGRSSFSPYSVINGDSLALTARVTFA